MKKTFSILFRGTWCTVTQKLFPYIIKQPWCQTSCDSSWHGIWQSKKYISMVIQKYISAFSYLLLTYLIETKCPWINCQNITRHNWRALCEQLYHTFHKKWGGKYPMASDGISDIVNSPSKCYSSSTMTNF